VPIVTATAAEISEDSVVPFSIQNSVKLCLTANTRVIDSLVFAFTEVSRWEDFGHKGRGNTIQLLFPVFDGLVTILAM